MFVFVYGTLMTGYGASLRNNPKVEFIQEDTIPAKMFNLISFPGIKLDDRGEVHGELYEVLDESIMSSLDAYEGYYSDMPNESLYLRKETTTKSGVKTFVYEYNHDTDLTEEIPSGNWRKQ